MAGTSEPGRIVRVYANEIVLGETKASAGGRFLIEAERDLPVGNYIIRADVLDADGVKVIARAAVPFEREPGEIDRRRCAARRGSRSGRACSAAARSAGEPRRPSRLRQSLPPPAAEPAQSAETPPAVARAAEPPAAEPAAPAQPNRRSPPKRRLPSRRPSRLRPGSEVAAAPPPEATAPKLQKVQGAVIIRRGDSLWRISRRVYGRGVRYSTIYLANQEQIRDPDRIWPGQVFRVPDKTSEGEAADMTAIGEQATTTTTRNNREHRTEKRVPVFGPLARSKKILRHPSLADSSFIVYRR